MNLPPGRHLIDLVRPGFAVERREVTVVIGESQDARGAAASLVGANSAGSRHFGEVEPRSNISVVETTSGGALMTPAVAKLTLDDMMSLAAFAASLQP